MNSQFKDNLMKSEADNASARARYEKSLAGLMEFPLEWPRKSGLVFALLVSIGTVVLSTILAIRFHNGPAVMLEGFALGGVFGIVGAVITARILLRGTYHRRRDTVAQANLIWVFVVLMEVVFMEMDGFYPKTGGRMTLFGLVFLIGGAVLLLRTVIEQSELRTREKLLEVQLDVAEMKEAMGNAAR